jgi:hypothetical protein
MRTPSPNDLIHRCTHTDCNDEVRAGTPRGLASARARHDSVRHGVRRTYTGKDEIRRAISSIPASRLQRIRRLIGATEGRYNSAGAMHRLSELFAARQTACGG